MLLERGFPSMGDGGAPIAYDSWWAWPTFEEASGGFLVVPRSYVISKGGCVEAGGGDIVGSSLGYRARAGRV